MEQKNFKALLRRTLVIPVIALAILAAVLLGEIQSLKSSMQWVDHTDQVISANWELMKLTIDLETGVRGYLNTGRDEFLQPDNEAKQTVDSQFGALNQLVSDNPAQQAQLAAIRSRFDQWRQYADRQIDLRRRGEQGGYEVDLQGKQLMDSVRAEDVAFLATEERLRKERVRKADDTSRLVTITCILLSLGIAGGLATFTRRQMHSLGADFQQALDIAQKRAEALSEQAELLDVAHDAIMVRDLNGTIRFWNHGAEGMYGYSKQQATGRISHELLRTVFPHPLGEIEAGLLREDRWEGELIHTTQDGARVVVATRWVLRRDKNGQPYGVMEINNDITERKRAEEALRSSLAVIVESSADAILSKSLDGTILTWNQGAERLYGYTAAEAVGQSMMLVVPPEEQDELRESLRCIARGERVEHHESVRVRKDGSRVDVSATLSPICNARGEVTAASAIVRDISERKRAEEAVRQANAYNRSLLEASLDPLVTIGPDGKITDVNAATEAVTGCARAALIGTDFSDYFTDPEKARAGYQQVFREGFVRDYPLELRQRGGYITSVLYNASVYQDESGQVAGVFAAARDISERKRAEEAVRRANAYNRSLLEASLDPLVTIGPDGKITDVNAATEAVTGCARAALIGTDFSDYFTDPEKARAGYQQVFREGFVRDYPLELRQRGGHITSVLYNASVYRDESGKVAGVFAAARDITERKRAEEEVRHYAEDLKRSNQELEHFAYVASHDLQEPLRTVSSFSQLLARRCQGKLDADADEFITFIVEGARRMQTLINDLLAFSRIGTRGNPFAQVDGEEILQAVQENLDMAIVESGAMITHDPLPTLRADPAQLTQLFQNLFGNAIKFRRPEEVPRIHLFATRQDGAWQFSVRDNGIGIEPQYFERIFTIFQRLHGREEYPGTGIGLAICKKIVERHDGRIWVESEAGTGSTFHFTIPDERRNFDEPSQTH